MALVVTAMRHAAHVNSIARFEKYPEDQEGEGPFARRGRPSRGHSPDLPERRRNREAQPVDLSGRAHREGPRRGRLGNLQAELGLSLTRSGLASYRSASAT